MAVTSLTFPGQILGPASSYNPGKGTHLHHAHICASIPGIISKNNSTAPKPPGIATTTAANTTTLPTLSVSRTLASFSSVTISAAVLPTVDSTVLARVTRINPRQATVEMLVVGETVCAEGWQGLIRVQDIRATEKDRVKVGESFRPGDVVRAVVISLGDQSNYYLSTASNLLGVVMASSEAGNAMYPVSWKEFRDPITGRTETRKVAKPF